MGSERIKISEEKARILETISIICLIIFALISHLFTKVIFKSTAKNQIAIYVGDKQITEIDGKKIDINIDNEFLIGNKSEDYNIIKIENGKVKCIESNCPDKVCVAHGELKDNIDNDMIICAPHKLTISYVVKAK